MIICMYSLILVTKQKRKENDRSTPTKKGNSESKLQYVPFLTSTSQNPATSIDTSTVDPLDPEQELGTKMIKSCMTRLTVV